MSKRMQSTRSRHGGVTLIELVVSIVVISIALSALVLLVSSNTGRSVDPMIQQQASAIAQAYMEEISGRSFCDPDYDADADPATPLDCPAQCTVSACGSCAGPAAGLGEGTRAQFDDICDYAALPDTRVRDHSGSAIPALAQYLVNVNIIDAGAQLDTLNSASGQVLRIDVTVTHPQMPVPVAISGWRANY